MKVKIYITGRRELIGVYNARSVYDPVFYFRNMPTLSARQCREILNTTSSNYKMNFEEFVFEDVDTGHNGVQKIYKNGTILNF